MDRSAKKLKKNFNLIILSIFGSEEKPLVVKVKDHAIPATTHSVDKVIVIDMINKYRQGNFDQETSNTAIQDKNTEKVPPLHDLVSMEEVVGIINEF